MQKKGNLESTCDGPYLFTAETYEIPMAMTTGPQTHALSLMTNEMWPLKNLILPMQSRTWLCAAGAPLRNMYVCY